MKLILTGLVAWLLGLVTILCTSLLLFETPSWVDITSFGTLLFVGSLNFILLLYLPFLAVLRNNKRKYLKFAPLLLAFGINVPVYAMLALVAGQFCSSGEILLFNLGFGVVAFVFGLAYSILCKHSMTTPIS